MAQKVFQPNRHGSNKWKSKLQQFYLVSLGFLYKRTDNYKYGFLSWRKLSLWRLCRLFVRLINDLLNAYWIFFKCKLLTKIIISEKNPERFNFSFNASVPLIGHFKFRLVPSWRLIGAILEWSFEGSSTTFWHLLLDRSWRLVVVISAIVETDHRKRYVQYHSRIRLRNYRDFGDLLTYILRWRYIPVRDRPHVPPLAILRYSKR